MFKLRLSGMEKKIHWSLFLSVLNLLLLGAFIVWFIFFKNTNFPHVQDFEQSLIELTHQKPRLLVDLLNASANSEQKSQKDNIERFILKNRAKVFESGFQVRKVDSHSQKTLVIFMDATCPHCVTFLKNTKAIFSELDCSVILIPISVLGDKANYQARLIMAAALQSATKAMNLVAMYTAIDGVQNNVIDDAKRLELDIKKLTADLNKKSIHEAVKSQTRLSQESGLPGVPSIFLVNDSRASFLPPTDAETLKNMIANFGDFKYEEDNG